MFHTIFCDTKSLLVTIYFYEHPPNIICVFSDGWWVFSVHVSLIFRVHQLYIYALIFIFHFIGLSLLGHTNQTKSISEDHETLGLEMC